MPFQKKSPETPDFFWNDTARIRFARLRSKKRLS
jgi:hypothetical protein